MSELHDPAAAARVLARVPVFATLAPVARAKLAGVLELRGYDAGEVVFETGTLGDALYVLFEGSAERRVDGAAIDQLRPPDYFGELALLTDELRSASVIATTPVRLWVLPRERFHSLLRGEPDLMLGLVNAVGLELVRTRRLLGGLRRELDAWVAERLAVRSDAERTLIETAAFFERPSARLLASVEALAAAPHTDTGTVPDPETGVDTQTDPDPEATAAARLLAMAASTPLLHSDGEHIYLLPAVRLAVQDLLRREQRHAGGAARLRAAAERLQADGQAQAAASISLAIAAPGLAAAPTAAARATPDMPGGARAAARPGWLGGWPGGWPGGWRSVHLLLALLPLLAWWVTPPPGLDVAAWRVLLTLLSAAVLFATEALPEAAVALALLGVWGLTGVVPAEAALAGFATETWLLVLAVLAVGAAVGASGLLYRVALLVLGRRPRGYAWRCVSIALIGTLVTPTLPNATSRMALAAPMVREIAEALGYRPGSRAAAGLALAALVGFGQMSMLFLTGASVGLLVHGLLPDEVRARFDFLGWFIAALPLHLLLFVLALGAIVLCHGRTAGRSEGGDRLALQRAVLGPMRGDEKLCLTVLLLLIGAFISAPLHGVGSAWLAVAAVVALSVGGALDATRIRTGVNWNFLVFFGAITSLAGVFRDLGVDAWLAGALAGPLQLLAGSSLALCLALTLSGFALSFLVRWQAAAPILTLVCLAPAEAAGINPFLVGLLALVSTQVWFLPYQSTVYMALYQGTGDLFAHRDVRLLAWLWGPLVLIAVAASVPLWRMMGLAA